MDLDGLRKCVALALGRRLPLRLPLRLRLREDVGRGVADGGS